MRLTPPRSTLSPYTTLFRSPRLGQRLALLQRHGEGGGLDVGAQQVGGLLQDPAALPCRDDTPFAQAPGSGRGDLDEDRKSTRLNSSHVKISYAVFCLKKKTL